MVSGWYLTSPVSSTSMMQGGFSGRIVELSMRILIRQLVSTPTLPLPYRHTTISIVTLLPMERVTQ